MAQLETPGTPTVAAAASDQVKATFTAVTGATGYHYRYRAVNAASWTEATETAITTTTFTIGGLTAGTTYEVQVRALRNLETGAWSPSGRGRTLETNEAPEFDKSSYSAGLVKNTAGNGEGTTAPIPVITVSAADPNTAILLKTLTYSITAGNTGSKFAIDAATGAVTYVGSGETGSSDIALTVGVSDGRDAGGEADTAVDDTGTLTVSLVDSCGLGSNYNSSGTTTISLAASCIGIKGVSAASGTLTVNGNGYTIRGRSDASLFDAGSAKIVLNNLTIEKTLRPVTVTSGRAEVNNVSFIGNELASYTGTGRTYLKNVYFEGNREQGNKDGSAIHLASSGTVRVIDSKFVNNNSGDYVINRVNDDLGSLKLQGCHSRWGNIKSASGKGFSRNLSADESAGECLGRTGNPGVGNDPNAKPSFYRASYAFGLLKDGDGSGDGDAIPAGGAVASDPDAASIYNTLAYSITAGNPDDDKEGSAGKKFAIDAATGAITYIDDGEGAAGTAFTLTVGVSDGKNAAGAEDTTVDDTATVKVKVVESCGLQGEHEYAADTTVNLAASCLGIKKVDLAPGKL